MKNLDWFQAEQLVQLTGRPVRREDWRKWLVRGFALWFIDRTDADTGEQLHYVVPNGEFTAAEFTAQDWTDEPWDGTPPPPWPPVEPPYWPPGGPPPPWWHGDHWPPLDGGGHSWGGPGNPPGGGSVVHPPFPPPGGGGGGDGPGGGGDEHPHPHPPHEPPAGQTPTITVTIQEPDDSEFTDSFRPDGHCFFGGSTSPRTLAEMHLDYSIMGGPAGVGTMTIELQGTTHGGMTGWPGKNDGDSFSDIHYTPGATVTATLSYTINGTNYTGTGDYTFPDWCSGPPTSSGSGGGGSMI